jgi:type I restriction enzyme, S subunit
MKRWPNKLLIEVAAVIRGISFDKSQVSNEPSENSIPILRAGNIQDSLLIDSDLVYVPQELVSEEQLMRRGDLAICMSSGSSSIVGKSAHLVTDWRGSVGAFCAIVRFNAQIHHRFGSYWFRSPAFLRWRDSNAKGANIQNLRRAELEKLSVPVPPLAEQERIVKLLDEADELRKLRAQADRRTAAFIPALFHEMFGDSEVNRDKFPLRKLGDVSEILMGQAPPGSEYNFNGTGVPFVKAGEFGEVHPIIREWTTKPIRTAKSSDVLVCVVGATCGKLNIGIDCAIGRSVAAIRPNPSLLAKEFLYVFLRGWTLRLRHGSQGSAQGVITRDMLVSIPMPLPPLPLQNEFARRIAEIREIEAKQAASRKRRDDLFQSMLYRAFNGDL